LERVEALLECGRYVLAAEGEARAVRAMALVALFPSEGFAHLDYLATAPSCRTRGCATRLLAFLKSALPQSPFNSDLLTLELDGGLAPWYERRGALLMDDVPYLFPAAAGPRPMKLMVFPFRNQTELAGEQVQGLVRALYAGLHGRGPQDPILQSFVDRVSARVSLRLTSIP
jgi:hypothetical protein